jgi:L-ascorbate metabolism protein UlaG (beta-lactamase superfamily)
MDMMLIGEYNIDVALLPIGGRYTMDIEQAVEACKLLKCKMAIPMHYNTWDVIKADPEEFKKRAPCEVTILKPGETLEV